LTTFALAALDEIWVGGALAERRLTHGVAEQRGNEIVATDARDDSLLRRCSLSMQRLRDAMPRDLRVRLVSRASTEGDEATMTVWVGGVSIVTDAEHVEEDVSSALAQPPLSKAAAGTAALQTIVWHNGSGSILLHEAYGHAKEHNAPPLEWPSWLSIDAPLTMRRESFRDVPILRMTKVVVAQNGAPFELPDERIDVYFVAGGAYDPLTDIVTIDVARASVPPFTIRAPRVVIAQSLAGASGDPVRYPGVVCSREGQQLVVGSYAPTLITAGLT